MAAPPVSQYAGLAGRNDDKRLPPHVTIFDSCPGLFRIPRAVAFVSVGLSSFQQLVAAPFLYALESLLVCFYGPRSSPGLVERVV